jgi:hypothetical protein
MAFIIPVAVEGGVVAENICCLDWNLIKLVRLLLAITYPPSYRMFY